MKKNSFQTIKRFSKIIFGQSLVFIFLILALSTHAQISSGGTPASFDREIQGNDLPVYSPKIPFSLTKNEPVGKLCTAYEFGKILPLEAKLSDLDFGQRTKDQDGNLIWKAEISSPNALAIGLYFSDFHLPRGAKLFIYNPDKEQLIGSFTDANNPENGLFATELIFGDRLIIEYNEPAHVAGIGRFTVSEVLHAYRGISDLKNAYGFRGSGACEVNVKCPEGADYEKQTNSVVRLLIKEGSSSYWCTGSVINNVRRNRTPYILTADHCGIDSNTTDLSQWIFYFNYQSATCTTPTVEPIPRTMTGCSKIAASSNAGILGSDFYLVLLNQNIPVEYNAYFMGWDRSGNGSTNGVTIHHPQGDIKKISTYTTPLSSATYMSGGLIGAAGGSWEVTWAATVSGHGVTEGGSSGSPIYSQDGFLIGTLTGGWASCSALTQPDYYGKFNFHWDKNGTTTNTQLKPWLDPDNTGAITLSGNPVGIETPTSIQDNLFTLFPNPSDGQFFLRFTENAAGENFDISVSNMLGQNVFQENIQVNYQYNLNLQQLSKGVYFIEIKGDHKRQVTKFSIQ
ncbi:MAG: T9SS type A sorting domain-containing protein [Bacteroidales bacterium]|nr:T9SS type A sorting domain-containing protein [Bacteroidales bacterium]